MASARDMSRSVESSLSLETILDSLPLALFCKDYESGTGVFINWNSSAEKLWGLGKEEAIGKSDNDFFPKEQADFFLKKDLETLRTGELVFIEEEPVDSPSGKVMVRTWKVPIEGRYLLGISQDITQLKELESELKLQREIALQTAKLASLGEMAGGIAHEINNPLAIINGHFSIIRKLCNRGMYEDGQLDISLDVIGETLGRIKAIIDGLRIFTRSSEEAQTTPVRADEIYNDCLSLCQEKLRSYDIAIVLDQQEPDLTCMANRVQIGQVMMNLISNSIAVIKDLESPWIRVEITRVGEEVEIRILDSGAGIPEELRPRLFEPFFTTKEVGEGTGLGLSISRGLVEKQGGHLWCDFNQPHTCFVLSLSSAQN